ncbi:NAD(P)-dependent oxidoreductase [Actinotalea caeni]|uniref:NAD(P)-dependent oxidoreductase n=1 Tax=Actinotalea caeni TaxID=1348467 RepID=UPI0012E114EC|nr:NAD(P)-binding domain-containing protein [Actinotalea caeni]
MSAIGFIGPGVMGTPMIANLVKAGHEVFAYGRSDRSRERVASTGATVADSIGRAAESADVIITMLPDTPDVEAVVLGKHGLASSLRPDQTYVDMSTIRPDVSRSIADRLASRGVAALDAPVSGGEAAAIEGTLSVMVGGDADQLQRVRPALEAMSSSITHVGPAGAGQLAKAANQLIVATNIAAVSEAIVLLESSGVRVEEALSAIAGGLGGSAVLDRKREAFLTGSFAPGFRIALHNKDLSIVRETAEQAGAALPVIALVSQLMAAAGAQGLSELDHSAMLTVVRSLNAGD